MFFFMSDLANAALITKAPNNLGLVGYWAMNEGRGSTVGDSSGNGNTGTLVAGPIWANGKRSNALTFSFASTSYANIPLASNFNFGSGNMTVSGWVKATFANDGGGVVTKGSGVFNGGGVGWAVRERNSGARRIEFCINDGIGVCNRVSNSNAGALTANTWYFFAFTYVRSTGEVIAYLNDLAPVTNTNSTGTYTDSYAMQIGNSGDGSIDGSVDDVRLYNRVLSATEIAALYKTGQVTRKVVSNQGLVGYWAMNEGRASVFGDSSGNGTNGILTGTTSPTWVSGKRGTGLSFDGVSSRALISGSTMIPTGATQFTVAAWAKKNTAGGGMVAYKNGPFFLNMGTVLGNSNFVVHTSGGWAGAVGATTLNVGQWYHLALTYDSSNSLISLYVNGKLDGTGAQTGGIGSAINCIGVGYSSDGNCDTNSLGYFSGSVDDLRLYNRALAASEIQSLYGQNETKINSSQNTRMADGLVGLWSFNGADYDTASTTAEVLERSGRSYNGDASNSPATIIGKVGQALKFDGVDDYVQVPPDDTNMITNATGTLSFSFWISPTTLGGTIISRRHFCNNDGHFTIRLSGGGALSLLFYSNIDVLGGQYNSGNIISTGQWQHVVISKKWGTANSTKLYLNGVAQSFTAAGSDTTQGTNYSGLSEIIGAEATSVACQGNNNGPKNNFYNGGIDEMRVYNKVLSADEAKQLYNMGK